MASGQDFAVGHGLKPCTTKVKSSQPFYVNGRDVVLIDTPGFDDALRNEFEILEEVADHLEKRQVLAQG